MTMVLLVLNLANEVGYCYVRLSITIMYITYSCVCQFFNVVFSVDLVCKVFLNLMLRVLRLFVKVL